MESSSSPTHMGGSWSCFLADIDVSEELYDVTSSVYFDALTPSVCF